LKRSKDEFFEKISLKDHKTVTAYQNRIKTFESFLSFKSMDFETLYTIDEEKLYDVLQGYINWFAKDHSPNSVWNYTTSIRKYLHYRGIEITSDKFKENMELPAKGEKELYALQPHEIISILGQLRYKDQCLFLCQLSSGMRIGEIVQLRKKHLILDRDRIIVKIPQEIAKLKRARTTMFSREAGIKLTPILKKIQDDDLIFGTSDDPRMSESNKEDILRRALNKCGLGMRYDDTGRYMINTHSFRAYFITKTSRFDPNFAKKMTGEKGYLLSYDRLTVDDYLELYLKVEKDLLIYDHTRKDKQIEDLQSSLNDKAMLTSMLETLKMQLKHTNERMAIIESELPNFKTTRIRKSTNPKVLDANTKFYV